MQIDVITINLHNFFFFFLASNISLQFHILAPVALVAKLAVLKL